MKMKLLLSEKHRICYKSDAQGGCSIKYSEAPFIALFAVLKCLVKGYPEKYESEDYKDPFVF